MRLCVVGIGGCGGKVAREFLGNRDLDLSIVSRLTGADYTTAGGIKGIWLDSDRGDAEDQRFFKDMNKDDSAYPGFFIPHDKIPKGGPVHEAVGDLYGFDLKKQGYVRAAQYLKSIFEIFENDGRIKKISAESIGSSSPIFDSSWEAMSQYTTLAGGKCDCILFIISLGGGTGTGFVNPIVQHIRGSGAKEYPVFALGVLTEEEAEAGGQQTELSKRNLGAIISIYDLVTKADGVDGLIIVDNQILLNKFKRDYTSINRFLYQMMRPIVAGRDYPGEAPDGQAMGTNLRQGFTLTPVLIPCYSYGNRKGGQEVALVDQALSPDGRYMGCDPAMADKAYVFCRGYHEVGKIEDAIKHHIPGLAEGDIYVWRKLSDDSVEEMLILLRNPYGSPGAYEKSGTFEMRLHLVITTAIDYIENNRLDLLGDRQDPEAKEEDIVKLTKVTRDALESYFYGEEGLLHELNLARIRLEEGLEKGEKRIFRRPLRIFDGGGRSKRDESSLGVGDSGLTSAQQAQILRMIQEEIEKRGPGA